MGKKLTVIAWLWARTVKSPNPAFAQVDVPLASTFMLSTKAGKEAYVEPVMEVGGYRFTVKMGNPANLEAVKCGTKVGRGGNFLCLMSATPIPVATIREQGLAGTFGSRLMAIVAEGERGRVYLAPTSEHEAAAAMANPSWRPDQEINHNPRDIRTQLYGLTTYGDLFTPRQLVALTTFSELVKEARERVMADALAAGRGDDNASLVEGGLGARSYSDAIGAYLGLAIGKLSDNASTICSWHNGAQHQMIRATFSRQALPMTWDFAEGNSFSVSSGNFSRQFSLLAEVIDVSTGSPVRGTGVQLDAASQDASIHRIVSTDPPYYDNIGYADLSDFFYVWLRRSLKPIFPELFATLAVPKAEELVATPYRHGGKESAEKFFLDGMTFAMQRIAEHSHPAFPVTIYYAFK